jgi:YgiT-type zinc finger domain-containing protein
MGLGVQKESATKCVVYKQAETRPGTATVTLERDGLTVVFKGVPAQVCPNCGEDYVESAVADRLLEEAEQTARNGTQVEVRQFAAA